MEDFIALEQEPDGTNPAEEQGRVFTIGPDKPFLRTLADQLICGDLIEGYVPKSDPLSLADCTIYLPTRRAARALALELQQRIEALTGSAAVILPRIRTLGDMDEEEQLDDIAGFADEISSVLSELGNVIDPVERHLTLARLTNGWINSMSEETRRLFREEHIVLPASAADALRLASDLADFMDQVETEEADWEDISYVTNGDHAKWWEVTLRFLDILMKAWPEYLAETGRINPATLRKRIADYRIRRLQENPPKGPVIAAGSTGSIPATARLLTCIAAMKNGAVILPGLDRELSSETARRFTLDGELSVETASSTHPQYAMVKLLAGMKIKPSQVIEIGEAQEAPALRGKILNICLEPADQTGNWMEIRSRFDDGQLYEAFGGLHLVEAPGERVEALSIALILREALETEGKTAALVTPDRQLARRVVGELERFGIEIDDSAGSSLLISPAAMEMRHLLRIVFGEADPVSWSGFFKSRLAMQLADTDSKVGEVCGYESETANLFELAIIRDCLQLPDPRHLAKALDDAKIRVIETKYAPQALKGLEEDDWVRLRKVAEHLSQALASLNILAESHEALTIDRLAGTLLEIFGRDDSALFGLEGGEELFSLLESHSRVAATGFEFSVRETVAVFETLISTAIVRSTKRTHPRLQIFGTLEARLQEVDRIVLGGLNEGVWPPSSRNDPFLNRPMRSALGLPLPERRIGLAAHDFTQLSGHREVFHTRSRRQGDAPSIASRWLQRMETFLGKKLFTEIRERGNRYLRLAEMIDHTNAPLPAIERTFAFPPVETRPTSLSFSEIETWIRDPYAIYAKHVLGLYPLPDLVRSAEPALRGTLYHDIFASFIIEWHGAITPAAAEVLSNIADRHFEAANLPPEISAMWRPRFDEVAIGFLDWEKSRRDLIVTSHCEVDGKVEIGKTGFFLRGRADRIDVGHDGELYVVDYKTGLNPTARQARTLSPQLSLEGVVARSGKFEDVPGGDLAGLHYVRLREGKGFRADDITKERAQKLMSENELAEKALGQLVDLIINYQKPEQGYVSRYAPPSETRIFGDYNHLARVREWSIAEEGSDDNAESGE